MRAWDVQVGESSEAFNAFCHFRDLPIAGRSLSAAYQRHLEAARVQKGCEGVSKGARAPGSWQRWSRKWNWTARAGQFDSHLASKRVSSQERAAEKYSDEWAAVREKFLLSQLRTACNLALGIERRVEAAGGLLVMTTDTTVIPGVAATEDSPGSMPIERETKIDPAVQLKEIRQLAEFLRPYGEVGGSGGGPGLVINVQTDESWVDEKLRKVGEAESVGANSAQLAEHVGVEEWVGGALQRVRHGQKGESPSGSELPG